MWWNLRSKNLIHAGTKICKHLRIKFWIFKELQNPYLPSSVFWRSSSFPFFLNLFNFFVSSNYTRSSSLFDGSLLDSSLFWVFHFTRWHQFFGDSWVYSRLRNVPLFIVNIRPFVRAIVALAITAHSSVGVVRLQGVIVSEGQRPVETEARYYWIPISWFLPTIGTSAYALIFRIIKVRHFR